MAKAVLQEQQRLLLQQERQLASVLQGSLAGFEGSDAHATTLRQVLDTLDDLFLLVVVGEFNAGKSASINALLRSEVLAEGVIPTTDQVTVLRYGESQQQRQTEKGLLEISYPADFLHDISIVDTPGVNAVLLEHQRLTEEFVPRSDLILFVTSVDRPFTQSERVFLEHIRTWGKKIIIILNKIDLLRDDDALQQVIAFIREKCKQLLGFEPDIFPVSAYQAEQVHSAVGNQALKLWESSQFGVLEEYLFKTLDATERVRLKLLNPLGVMNRILGETRNAIEERAKLLAEDARTVQTIDEQLQLYHTDMQEDFKHRLGEIENIILEMRTRGDRFFDDTMRLRRVLDLVRGEKIKQEFESEVLSDSAARIDLAVQELIDWMVEQEHRFWQNVMEYLDRRRQVSLQREDRMLGSVGKQFDFNRRTLLQSVSRTVTIVIQGYDQQAEALQLSMDMRNAVAQAALTSAGGLGLGALIVAVMGTLAADVTGIIAGLGLVLLGYGIIPLKRRQAKHTFDDKMTELQTKLSSAMQEQFQKELNHSVQRVQDAIAPYTRFVRAEQQKTTTAQESLAQLNKDLLDLKTQIEAL
ncbi:dynamin family protein [Tengunoibacter tsumagoiensis]|uniref:Dynamin n=1 Tax=Tengunoibacter tsumagoiensis TaxID=2014871 RepID=A0A401ZWQ5_9CHLR|nr:dynamin family protein [Tengunoibacter tsumagoiensis]GCE11351.1 dynamin [Tengunoibacter tsumagoiensis]